MARIRSVKPELWTDPEFVECSLSARLLFIASWNFATDYGVLPDKPRQIKMQCLPADDCDITVLIEELVSHQFLIRRTAPNGDNVLVIRTFCKNQKINRATKGRWGNPAEWPDPPPPLNGQSLTAHGGVTERHPSDGKGRDNSEGDIANPRDQSTATVHELAAPDKRARDALWDALASGLGEARTETERSIRGRTLKELAGIGATPEHVAQRCSEYRRRYPDMALTDAALRKHWSDLATATRPKKLEIGDVVEMPDGTKQIWRGA